MCFVASRFLRVGLIRYRCRPGTRPTGLSAVAVMNWWANERTEAEGQQ